MARRRNSTKPTATEQKVLGALALHIQDKNEKDAAVWLAGGIEGTAKQRQSRALKRRNWALSVIRKHMKTAPSASHDDGLNEIRAHLGNVLMKLGR